MRKAWLVILGAVAGAAIAQVVDTQAPSALSRDAARLAAEAAGPAQPVRQVPASGAQVQLSFAPVVKRVAPAVVNIYSARVVQNRQANDPFFQYFFGQGRAQPRVERSLGSGVIVEADGLIVTNNHVVQGATEILVSLADRREFPAKLVFADPRVDLAVLRIDAKGESLPVARLGDSDRPEVGDVVLAIGNPFGVGQTVTQGIVSAVARTGVGVSDSQFFIQTDAAINPGNSGGALVTLSGDVVGINSSILSSGGGSNGVGFAIPANMVRVVLRGATGGKVVTAWIGAEGEALTGDSARKLGLDHPTGVLLTGVQAGGPAAEAGLKAGDIIYAVDGKEVADPGMLRYRIATLGLGRSVTVTLIRGGATRNVQLRLAPPPETPARALTRIGGQNLLSGLTVGNLSPAFAQEIGAGLPERGVVVVEVAAGAPAQQLNFLRPGDIIEALNGQPVANSAAVAQLAPNATTVRFSRGGQRAECSYQAGGFYCRS